MTFRIRGQLLLFTTVLALAALACSLGGAGDAPQAPEGSSDTLGDWVWLDSNGDGNQDDSEEGVGGVTVRLLDADGQSQAETETNAEGFYEFAGVSPGTYQIEFVSPEDMQFTLKDAADNDEVDSDARQSDGRTDPFEYEGGADSSWDAGLIPADSGPTPAPTTPPETPTPTAVGLIPSFHLTYEHTSPGSYSEIIVQVDNLEPGQEVSGVVTGPAVDGDGSFTATADEYGTAVTRVRITQFGTYSAEVPDLELSGSVEVTAADPQ